MPLSSFQKPFFIGIVYIAWIFINHISFIIGRALEDRQSTLGIGDTTHTADDIQFDELEIVPHFQRVSISGEDTSGVPLEDLEHASSLIIKALEIRERYMSHSLQSFPQTTQRFLKTFHNKTMGDFVEYEDKRTTAGKCDARWMFNHFHSTLLVNYYNFGPKRAFWGKIVLAVKDFVIHIFS